MTEPNTTSRVCGACGITNETGAERCVSCGAELNETPNISEVDPDRRVELTRFDTERGDEAEIACGLLRANGIKCELSGTALPGLPADLIIWVNPEDARQAQALLEEAQRSIPREEDEAA